MSGLRAMVFTGAVWMLSMRMIVNSLGIISSIVLARLLAPDDFGLIALAGTAYTFLQVFGQFGFDSALIHQRSEAREYYDSAWTVNIFFGLICAVLLWVLADAVSMFFDDARIATIVKVFAVFSLAKGFDNIGFVKFRKGLRYDKDFYYFVLPKIVSVLTAIPIAYYYRTYWALIIGMAVSRLATLAYSYMAHDFRPRIGVDKISELFGFSKWILLNSILGYIGRNGIQVLIGRFATPFASGIFSLSKDIGRLPSTEFIQPINRALFPGFSTISENRDHLKSAYLKSMSGIASITVPAAVGIFLLSNWIVSVLLGEKWLAAIPVLQLLALSGMIEAVKGAANPLFLATGNPRLLMRLQVAYIILMFPLFGTLLYRYDLETAVISIPICLLATMPLWVTYLKRVIPVSVPELGGPLVRPALATLIMSVVLVFVQSVFEMTPDRTGPLGLVGLVLLGASVYLVSLLMLWHVTGRRPGFEETVLSMISERRKRTD